MCTTSTLNPRICGCRDDLEFVAKMVDRGAIDRLQHVANMSRTGTLNP
jgi:hypothetical protein